MEMLKKSTKKEKDIEIKMEWKSTRLLVHLNLLYYFDETFFYSITKLQFYWTLRIDVLNQCALYSLCLYLLYPHSTVCRILDHRVYYCRNCVTVNFHLYHRININRQRTCLKHFKPFPYGLWHIQIPPQRVKNPIHYIIIIIVICRRFPIVRTFISWHLKWQQQCRITAQTNEKFSSFKFIYMKYHFTWMYYNMRALHRTFIVWM